MSLARLSSVGASATVARLGRSVRHQVRLPAAVASASSHATSSCCFSMRSGPSTPHEAVAHAAAQLASAVPSKSSSSRRPASFAVASYGVRESGAPGSLEWRLHLQSGGRDISAWHDIPLLATGSSHKQLLFNYVNEIPQGSRPKLEIATKEPGNPIKQDTKKGKLRAFTYGDLPFNYGCLPQTWENPYESHPLTKLNGDNDPLDVVELSGAPLGAGAVHAVKVLGVLALLDEGETDWKVLAIRADHPLADSVHSLDDFEVHHPGTVHAVREWFRNYKTTDGKPQNQFAFEERAMDKGLALAVIWETHASWAALAKKEIPKGELWTPEEVPKAAKGE